jgi:SOS response regulatory protein OraA/RecX
MTLSTAARRLKNIAIERYLSRRPHSLYEVKTKLSKLKDRPSKDVIAEAVTSLSDTKLVDDTAFATYFTTSRVEYKARSKLELVQELRLKGIDTDIITKTIQSSQHDESIACEKTAARKHRATDKELKMYLSRKGFNYSIIQTTLEKRNLIRQNNQHSSVDTLFSSSDSNLKNLT